MLTLHVKKVEAYRDPDGKLGKIIELVEERMLTLHVRKVEAYRDPDGKLGKIIELVEERSIPRMPIGGDPQLSVVIHESMQAMQQVIPQMTFPKNLIIPKIVLFLTEEESERLGVTFEVNRTYLVRLEKQKIEFCEEKVIEP